MIRFLQMVFFLVIFTNAIKLSAAVKAVIMGQNLQGYGFEMHVKNIMSNTFYPEGTYFFNNSNAPIIINGVTFTYIASWTKSNFGMFDNYSSKCPTIPFKRIGVIDGFADNSNNYIQFTRGTPPQGTFFSEADTYQPYAQFPKSFAYFNDLCNGSNFDYSSSCIGCAYIQGFVAWVNGNKYYGWARFMGTMGSYTLLEYAYEDIPNLPIAIGAKSTILSLQNKSIITGKVYLDRNNNCTYNSSTELSLPNITVRLNDTIVTTTDEKGEFYFLVSETPTTYNIKVADSTNQFRQLTSCSPLSIQVLSGGQMLTVNAPMEQVSCGNVEVSIDPIQLRRCFRNQIPITVLNRNPNAPSTTQLRVILPPLTSALKSTPAWNSKKGDTLYYSILTPTFLGRTYINITDSVHCYNENYLGVGQCVKAEIIQDITCMNGMSYSGSDIISYGVCNTDYYEMYIKERGHTSASDSTYYEIFLNDTLVKHQKILLSPNDSIKVIVPTKGKSMYVKISQDAQHPLMKERTWVGEGCGDWSTQTISKGYLNSNAYTKQDIFSYTQCEVIRGSYDPNDKQAFPSRADHLVRPNQEITYKIRFQNTGTDKALHVCVVDTIAPYLDMNSIKDVMVSHPATFKKMINVKDRVIYFQFTDINLPYKSADNEGSNGYVQFTISQKEDVALGTEINNTAAIYFDYNSPVITNTTSQIVGEPTIADQQLKLMSWNGSTTVCENDKLLLKPTTNGVVTYTWYDPQGNVVSQTDSLVIPRITTDQAGLYKLKLKGRIDSIEVNSAMIQVNNTPDLVSTDLQSCMGATIDLADQVEDLKNLNGDYYYYLSSVSNAPLTSSTTNEPGTYYVIKNSNGCTDTTSIQFVTQMCTNTNGAKNAVNLKMYPNPTQDYLNIETEQSFSYAIIKSDGSLMESGVLAAGKREINVKSWSKGFYVFQVLDKGTPVYQESIVVQ